MITFVICSVCPERSADVARNIRSTSGIAEPEIFIHDNREVNWSLCKVYNHYSPKASNDIICYVHEDLYFRTRDWAEKIVSFYRDNPDTGVVGFLGSQIKTKAPSAVGCDPKYELGSLIQHTADGRVKMYTKKSGPGAFSRVVQIDGLCLIVRKSVHNKYPFDERLFDGFHLYDLDFTVRIAQYYKNYVCHSVMVEHMSTTAAYALDDWCYYTRVFQDNWADKLPMMSVSVTARELMRVERFTAYKFYKNIIQKGRLEYVDYAREMYKPYATFLYDLKLLRHRLRLRKVLKDKLGLLLRNIRIA